MVDYKFREITEKIIGSAMKVHAASCNGFPEVIYQGALETEMKDAGLNFARVSMPVYCKSQQIGKRRVDFFAEEKIIVGLKAAIQLENVHLVQAKNYLEAYNVQVGLLFNFGSISLQFKRSENSKFTGTPLPLNQ
jgi:GxxExxY protein